MFSCMLESIEVTLALDTLLLISASLLFQREFENEISCVFSLLSSYWVTGCLAFSSPPFLRAELVLFFPPIFTTFLPESGTLQHLVLWQPGTISLLFFFSLFATLLSDEAYSGGKG